MNNKYPLTDLGPLHWLLGIKVERDREARTIRLSQTSYINSIVSRFSLDDAKSVPTPLEPGATYSRTDCAIDPDDIDRMKCTLRSTTISGLPSCY